MAKKSLNLYIDENLKEEAAKLFKDLCLDLSTAVSIFFRKALLVHGIPFEITTESYNKETQDAFKEIKKSKKHPEQYKDYSSVNELMEDCLKDESEEDN